MRLHVNPATTGWLWVKAGVRTFWRQPLAMSGLFFMFMVVVSLLSMLPMVGTAVAMALFCGGLDYLLSRVTGVLFK